MNCTRDGTAGTPLVRAARRGDSLAATIVRTVAAVEDREPESLTPLVEVVDPEAAEAAVESADGPVSVSVSYAGHRVVVDEGSVAVY